MAVERHLTEREAIETYVRQRLAAECRKRGTKARIARIVGFDPAHLSNVVLSYRRVGEDLARKMAEYWGITYGELEQLALGIPLEGSEDPLPNLRLTLDWCREGYPADFLRTYGRLARKARTDRPRREWLDDIDSQLRRWARGEGICPSGIEARAVPPREDQLPKPPARPEPTLREKRMGKDAEPSRERLKPSVTKRRLEKSA